MTQSYVVDKIIRFNNTHSYQPSVDAPLHDPAIDIFRYLVYNIYENKRRMIICSIQT